MLFKLIKRILGLGHIKTVSDHMKPLVKARDGMQKAQAERRKEQVKNEKRMEKLVNKNEFHQAEIELADQMIEALGVQLKPLDTAKEVAKRG